MGVQHSTFVAAVATLCFGCLVDLLRVASYQCIGSVFTDSFLNPRGARPGLPSGSDMTISMLLLTVAVAWERLCRRPAQGPLQVQTWPSACLFLLLHVQSPDVFGIYGCATERHISFGASRRCQSWIGRLSGPLRVLSGLRLRHGTAYQLCRLASMSVLEWSILSAALSVLWIIRFRHGTAYQVWRLASMSVLD